MASFITLDGSSAESMFGLNGIANGALIRTIIISATATTIFSIYNSNLFLVYYDSNNSFGTQAKYVTNGLNTLDYATYKNDMDLKSDNSEGWMAVISTDNKIYGFSTTIGQVNSLTMANSFSISGFSSAPVFITVMYIDITHWMITTMLTDGSGVIMKVDQSTTASPTVSSKKITGLSNGRFIGYKLSTGFLLASSKIGKLI